MGPAHFAAGLAAKSIAPKAPVWVLLLASEATDLLCFGFIAAGLETSSPAQVSLQHGIQMLSPASVPWSHGLFMSVVWSLAAGLLAFLFLREFKASLVIGLAMFSHWALDLIVHPHELPLLFSGSPMVGLGLWSSGPGLIISAILEIVLLAAGTAIYLTWRKRSRTAIKS